jgi:hypothetical protein
MSARVAIVGIVAAALSACGPSGDGPEFPPVEDQVVAIGQELVIVIEASDPSGAELSYSFSAEVPDIQSKARIARLPTGAGEFRWTPSSSSDLGEWFFDFSVSAGGAVTTETVRIEVRSAVGANSSPRFLRPQGMGTTLDTAADDCVELDVMVDDTDSASVEIEQGAPVIEGANLQKDGNTAAVWRWCPKPEQIARDNRYTLLLTADDGENPKTLHPYLIVLRKPAKQNCPGGAPQITHTAADVSSLAGIPISAQISDAEGLRDQPLLVYTVEGSSEPVTLMMTLQSGDSKSGTWKATIPNPVADAAQGAAKRIDYHIIADDDDDPEGDCDHSTTSTPFSITVTNPGGAGGAGLCEPCTSSVQCGDAGDLCVRVGSGSDAFCLSECSGPADCPTDYECSPAAVTAVDGSSGRQCVPISSDCSDPGGGVCADDDRENNDAREEAFQKPLLATGSENLVSCPARSGIGDDEDWLEIELETEAMVTLNIAGDSAADLDLALYDDNGIELDRSGGVFTSNEEVSACLAPGFYTTRVFAWFRERSAYTITYSKVDGPCGAICTDPTDVGQGTGGAQFVPTLPFSAAETVCQGDEDWYDVFMSAGERLVVDLTFEHSGNGDLDVHLANSAGTDLTPCEPGAASECDTGNGQSATSNEHFEMDITSSGVYYVIVRGFDADDRNDYSINIERQ